MLADLSIKDYLARTANSEYLPTGGCASALSAALAASLTEMVANLTISGQDSVVIRSQMEEIAQSMKELRKEFTLAIDRDADSYKELFAAYKMPEGASEEIKSKDEQIQKSILIAVMVPFDVAEMAMRMMDLIAEVARQADKKAMIDACAAIIFARSAVLSALFTIRVNFHLLKSKQIVEDLTVKSDDIEKQAIKKEQELLSWVKTKF